MDGIVQRIGSGGSACLSSAPVGKFLNLGDLIVSLEFIQKWNTTAVAHVLSNRMGSCLPHVAEKPWKEFIEEVLDKRCLPGVGSTQQIDPGTPGHGLL